MSRFSGQSRGSRSSARERFQTRRQQTKGARLQIFAVVAIVFAGAAYFLGIRYLPVDAFVGTLRVGDEEGRVVVRVDEGLGTESLLLSTAAGEVVQLIHLGPVPGRLFWGLEDFEAGRELDYNGPLATEIEQALREARAHPQWPAEAETLYQSLRARTP